MTWNHRYQLKTYLRSSLWIIPLFALLLEQVAGALAQALDARLAWEGLGFGVTGAQALLNAIITLTLSFIVFTFGSLLVAIQVASGQYTPRIIATTLLRDNVIRYTVGLFVFTFLFGIRDLGRTETTVHQFVAFVAGLLGFCRPCSTEARLGRSDDFSLRSIFKPYCAVSTTSMGPWSSQ
jgi:uncharacterized membrane protein